MPPQVAGHEPGIQRREVRASCGSHVELGPRQVRVSVHPDLAVAPGLRPDPLQRVEAVGGFVDEGVPVALRPIPTPAILRHKRQAAPHELGAGLAGAVVRRSRQDDRERTVAARQMHRCLKADPISHRDPHVPHQIAFSCGGKSRGCVQHGVTFPQSAPAGGWSWDARGVFVGATPVSLGLRRNGQTSPTYLRGQVRSAAAVLLPAASGRSAPPHDASCSLGSPLSADPSPPSHDPTPGLIFEDRVMVTLTCAMRPG